MKLTRQFHNAKAASLVLRTIPTAQKNSLLKQFAKFLLKNEPAIVRANQQDLAALPSVYPLRDRLQLTTARIISMADSVRAVARLPDPIGEILETTHRPSGLTLQRVRVPLGVIGVIYEARPNVTTEIFSLTLKTGNAVILKGGRDSWHTSQALIRSIHQTLRHAKLPMACCTMLNPHDRSATLQLLKAHDFVDVIIPRGGTGLIKFVREHAQVPVIETGVGVCHTYIEHTADIQQAAAVVFNAKTRRCTVCNALDTIVIDNQAIKSHLPTIAKTMQPAQVVIHADPAAYRALQTCYPKKLLFKAKLTDYSHEWLSHHLSVKTVQTYAEAVAFIQKHTSGHSEAILTRNKRLATDFTRQIDSAVVYVNTPTTFTDGFEFGLGAEVGISTQKLHARGPMGLRELTSYQWIVSSHGAIRPA